MKKLLFVSLLATTACTQSPTAPTPTAFPALNAPAIIGDPEGINTGGGKACVLTPTDPVDVPTCYYTCPNGVTFSKPNTGYPNTVCSRVSPQPKKVNYGSNHDF